MKKLVTMFLAVALCMGLAVPAMADEYDISVEDGIRPIEYQIKDANGNSVSYPLVKESFQVGAYYILPGMFGVQNINNYYTMPANTVFTLKNVGGIQDCYLQIATVTFDAMTKEEILADSAFVSAIEYSGCIDELNETGDIYVYYDNSSSGNYLCEDGQWRDYLAGPDNIISIEENESQSFTLPNPVEGQMYRISFQANYPQSSDPDYYYYRQFYVKIDNSAKPVEADDSQQPAEPETSGTYGPCTVTDYAGNEFSFTSAKVETGNITLDWFGDVFTAEDVTIITVQPGSTMTYSGYETGMTGYTRTGDTYAPIDAYTAWFGGTAPVDNLFGVYEEWQGNVVDMLSFYTFFDSEGDGSTDQEAYIILGDGAASEPTEPTTPAEPETPAETPEEPSVTAPNGTVTYTVQKGDTLGFIATNYYGDNAQRNSDRLKNVNTIYEGQVLVLPAK